MARTVRVEYPGALYHLMSHGVARAATYLRDSDRLRFLELLEEFVEDGRLIVYAYALMSNHFHLLAETPLGHLGRIMQSLLSRYSLGFNEQWKRTGHLWQARYKALLVQDGRYLLDCSRYIHRNPVEASLCRRPEEYPWSSYRNYLADPDAPPVWEGVSTDRVLAHFQDREAYCEYVESEKRPFNPFTEARAGIVLGDDEFLRRMREKALRECAGSETELLNLRRLKLSDESPSVDDVRAAVEGLFGDLSACQRNRILMLALHCCTWLNRREISQIAERRPDTVTRAVRAMKERVDGDCFLSERFEILMSRFGMRREP